MATKTWMLDAKRGDFLVTEVVRHDFIIGHGPSEHRYYGISTVSSVSRYGRVKAIRSLHYGTAAPIEPIGRIIGLKGTWLVPRGYTDADDLESAIRERGDVPFKSLEEAREFVRGYVRKAGGGS
jgi:hypothetical protein